LSLAGTGFTEGVWREAWGRCHPEGRFSILFGIEFRWRVLVERLDFAYDYAH
jgi:hypothetical protein